MENTLFDKTINKLQTISTIFQALTNIFGFILLLFGMILLSSIPSSGLIFIIVGIVLILVGLLQGYLIVLYVFNSYNLKNIRDLLEDNYNKKP